MVQMKDERRIRKQVVVAKMSDNCKIRENVVTNREWMSGCRIICKPTDRESFVKTVIIRIYVNVE